MFPFPINTQPFDNFPFGALVGVVGTSIFNHILGLSRNKKNRRQQALLDATLSFRDSVYRELAIYWKPAYLLPQNIEVILLDAINEIRPYANRLHSWMPLRDAGKFLDAWEDLVAFSDRRLPYQAYVTASLYPTMPKRENPIGTLRTHINKLLTIAGGPPLDRRN